LFERETGLLFSGDLVQAYGVPTSSGRSVYAPLYDDVDDYLQGLERLRVLPFSKLCPAHVLPLDRDEALELIDRSIAFTVEMDTLVADLLARADRPLSTADVATAVGEFCGTNPPVSIQTVYAATAHLKRAARNGNALLRWAPAARA
jgi:glyoxylase-like metal-dependent hydrolase (beta-lactamase superfamily II)